MPASQAAAAPGTDFLRPRRPAGLGRGALLALLVHGGLLVALAFGMRWRSSEPTGATAELWAALPQAAAPAAAPAPVPAAAEPPVPRKAAAEPARDAEIALERDRRERERERAARAEAEQQKRLALREEQRKKLAAQAEQQRQDQLRQDYLRRMLGQAGASGGPTATGTAARDAGPSAGYAGRIVARVKPNIVFADRVAGGLRAEVEVRAAPDGSILGRRLVKPSGNPDWDEAVLRAIDRTQTLPRDIDGRVPSPITIGFTP
jgi:colicin import membrane protein